MTLKSPLKKELDKMLDKGVIKKVTKPTKCVNQFVMIKKYIKMIIKSCELH